MRACNTFELNRGSDLVFSFNWPDMNGDPANITGGTISIIDAHAKLEGYIGAEIDDASTGLVTVVAAWDDSFPVNTSLQFRVLLTLSGTNQSTNLIRVVYA